jgi:lysophospholipase L1-like esterase
MEFVLAACALLTGGCSSPTLPSKTTIIQPPAITCPIAPSPVIATNGQSAVVTYGAATVTGGTAPLTESCAPTSGSTFAIGSTSVVCTATDAVSRTASCSFVATVTRPLPRLGVSTILAFGDSMTEGEVPVAGEFSIGPQFVMPDSAYPAYLTDLLAQRYSARGASRLDAFTLAAGGLTLCKTAAPYPQTPGLVVINAGCLGERAEDASTVQRLIGLITAYHPDVVLLLEGVNDLDSLSPGASIAAGVQGVRTLIAAAQSRNVRVMVGTLLPEVPAELTHGGLPDLIVPFNTQLVPAATNAGARVVDLYSAIAMDVTDWISPYDGLHPTAAGYQEMATVWLSAVRSAYELPLTSTVAASAIARPGAVVQRGLRR